MRSHSGLYLYKRNNGRYYLGQRIDDKVVWRSTGETTRSAALRHLKEFSADVAGRGECDSLSVFSERFLSIAQQNMAPKTVAIYRRTLKLLARVAGDGRLSRISCEHWDRYKSERMSKVAPPTVNQELRALRAALNTAVRWNYMTSNPFGQGRFVPIPEALPIYFTRDDIAKLSQVVDDPLYWDIILFAVLSGCRRGEIMTFRWEDYNPERGTLTIHSSHGFRTKSGKHRVIPAHSTICEILERRRGSNNSGLVFSDNGRRLCGNNVSRRIRQYIRDAGLRRELHFHSFRHTFASWLIQAGESLYTVQRLLGHTSPRMTQIYSHLEPTDLQRSVQKLTMGV